MAGYWLPFEPLLENRRTPALSHVSFSVYQAVLEVSFVRRMGCRTMFLMLLQELAGTVLG